MNIPRSTRSDAPPRQSETRRGEPSLILFSLGVTMRIAFIIGAVIVVDFLVFIVAGPGMIDVNMVEIAHAIAAQHDNPGPENQRALDAAAHKAAVIRMKVGVAGAIVILIVTSGGFFLAGRRWERRCSSRSDSQGLYETHANT